jgi:hypothetical protein
VLQFIELDSALHWCAYSRCNVLLDFSRACMDGCKGRIPLG